MGAKMDALNEIIETTDSVVKCDGGDGPLGHPVIYLNFGQEENIMCPYCSRRFVRPLPFQTS